jgi:D-alanine-D-alanine ligase-like ATP-grasp enzyme
VETPGQARKRIDELLKHYPAGLVVEEFITGRELSVPLIEGFPGKVLDIVEHTFDLQKSGGRYNIYDYDLKQGTSVGESVNVICPAEISPKEEKAVLDMARNVFDFIT